MEYNDDYSFSRSYITPGETVLWRGRPQPGRIITSQDVVMIPFSIFWCGFAFFWEYTALQNGAPFFFALFGLPFIAVGLYLVFGRFIHTAWLRKRTAYVITDLKIIRKRGNRIDMLDRASAPPAQIRAYADGSGTITFSTYCGEVYHNRHRHSRYSTFTLENIPEVARVHALLASRTQQ